MRREVSAGTALGAVAVVAIMVAAAFLFVPGAGRTVIKSTTELSTVTLPPQVTTQFKTVIVPPSTTTATVSTFRNPILVDSCGANPYDYQPDSGAIQQCINKAVSGDAILFTSPGKPGYKGYMIDKTIFLEMTNPVKTNLTFASTDPGRPALLNATTGLKGFVIELCARSQVQCGLVHKVVLTNLQVDGGADRRVGYGPDGKADGVDDNWGSWLPECSVVGDAWCTAGGINMAGYVDESNPSENYKAHPDLWSTGIVVENMLIQNVEVGTALGFNAAAGAIRDNVINGSGDHTHAPGCPPPDGGKDTGEWADGITFEGPDNFVSGNTVYDASDVGIVYFGGENTTISNNVVVALPGDHGMFAGIAVHPWGFGDVSGVKVTGNVVVNEGSSSCGGIHAGINIGQQMWEAPCPIPTSPSAVGNSGSCVANPPQPHGALCTPGVICMEWAYVKSGSSLTLKDNLVSGAEVNYLVEGLDLDGSFVAVKNNSETPRVTDWQGALGCGNFGTVNSWGPTDFVAHNPTLPGWTDIQIHCAG